MLLSIRLLMVVIPMANLNDIDHLIKFTKNKIVQETNLSVLQSGPLQKRNTFVS